MPKLVVIEGPLKGKVFEAHAGVSLGRSRTCAVHLQGRHVSRVHARLELRENDLAIVDVESQNGIFVNGQKFAEHRLKPGDEIEIGEHVLVFEPPDGAAPARPETSTRARPTGATAVLDTLVLPYPDPAHLKAETALENYRQLHGALQILRAVATVDDDHDLAKDLLDRIVQGSGARRGFLLLADANGRMKPAATSTPPGEETIQLSNVIHHQVHQERRALLGADIARGGAEAGKPVTILCAPIVHADAVIGFLYLDRPTTGKAPFTADDLRTAAGVLHLAAPLLAQARRTQLMRRTARAAWKRLEAEFPIITAGGAMQEVAAQIDTAAGQEGPVLIVGEPGTGRDLAARALHFRSVRANGPLIVLNAAAVPADVMDRTLFGEGDRKGLLQEARGGTLFLDEIGDLTPSLQQKLLKCLHEPAVADMRVVAATSRDLLARAQEGTFHPDLYTKLAATVLRLPPLRERKTDLPLLVAHFLRTLGGRQVTSLDEHLAPEVVAILEGHPWPGNVRQLRNAIERLLMAAGAKRITLDHVPPDLRA